MDTDDPSLLALKAAVMSDPRGIFEVQGTFDDSLSTCAKGAIVVELFVETLGAPPPPEEPIPTP